MPKYLDIFFLIDIRYTVSFLIVLNSLLIMMKTESRV